MVKKFTIIYALTVSLLALVCFMVALGVGIFDIIEIINPEFSLSYEEHLQYTQSPIVYENHQVANGSLVELPSKSDRQKYQTALVLQVHRAKKSLILVSIISTICVGMYTAHWQLAKRMGTPQSTVAFIPHTGFLG